MMPFNCLQIIGVGKEYLTLYNCAQVICVRNVLYRLTKKNKKKDYHYCKIRKYNLKDDQKYK